MTTLSEIILDAYRQSNLLALGAAPSSLQEAEALKYLNRIIESVYGQEAGDPLESFPIGRNNINRPQGFPYYDGIPEGEWYARVNQQLILNLTEPTEVNLDPMPEDGARFAVVDASANLNIFPFTLIGNGRMIENATSVILTSPGEYRAWFYRQDTGNWHKVTSLTSVDQFPFPSAFDDMFITMLAMRLNPAYGISIDQQSVAVLNRLKSQFRARYDQTIFQPSELGLLRLSKVGDRNHYYDTDGYSSESMWNRGYGRGLY